MKRLWVAVLLGVGGLGATAYLFPLGPRSSADFEKIATGSNTAAPAQPVRAVPPPAAIAQASGGPYAAAAPAMPIVPPGVSYIPIEQQDVPEEVKRLLRRDLERLRRTGSISGGEVTHEFARSRELEETLQREGLPKLVASLAISPSDVTQSLDASFRLVGASSQGKYIDNMGWSGYFQQYRSAADSRWVELSENQLDVLTRDGVLMSPEFLNARVLDQQATLESLRDRDGAYLFNVQWAAKDRVFHLTTRNFSRQEALDLATAVTNSYLQMAHAGWRTTYQFDPNNPLHRLAASPPPAPPFTMPLPTQR